MTDLTQLKHFRPILFQSRACLDTSYEGQLSQCKLMGIYRETFDVGTLSEEDQLSYSINIYPEDNILEIVSMCCTNLLIFFVFAIYNLSFLQLATELMLLPLLLLAFLMNQKRTVWLLVPKSSPLRSVIIVWDLWKLVLL